MTLGQAYTVLRSIAKTDDTGKTCRGISVLQDLMQPGCDPFPSSFYKIGEFLENQKQQLAACPNLDGGVVVPLQTMSYFARFTDGWEMDDRKEPMLPETSWKAYCGFSNSELHNLQLEIGDRCTYYEKVKLTKKEKKLVCKDGLTCGKKNGVCCLPTGSTTADIKNCCSRHTKLDGTTCR